MPENPTFAKVPLHGIEIGELFLIKNPAGIYDVPIIWQFNACLAAITAPGGREL